MKIVSSLTYKPKNGVKLSNKSLTVPDASYTIKDLLVKYASGIAPPVFRDGTYPDEDVSYGDSLRIDLDITDIHNELVQLDERRVNLENIKKKYDKAVLDGKAKKAEDAMRKKILDELSSEKSTKSNIEME